MPAHRKPRFSTEEELKTAVVTECLREINETVASEIPAEIRGTWTAGDSEYLCDGRTDPERETEQEEQRKAAVLFLKVREAIVEFEAWAGTIEGTPQAQRWPYSAAVETLVPALVPLVREPHNHRNILGAGMAESWRLAAQPPWDASARERLIFAVDRPILRGANIRFNAIGLGRPATDRELALFLLSAGYFPRIDATSDTVADVVTRERKTIAKERRRIWLLQTSGQNIGPNRLREEGDEASEPDEREPGGNREAGP